jgi:uncharacterized protein (TIGR02598 family)
MFAPTFPQRFTSRSHTTRSRRKAFSLTEVVIAIGVSTFAVLVIFSLMPVGLSAVQDASRQIVETEVFNAVGAELKSTNFDDLDNYVTKNFPRYYDNDGIRTTSDLSVYTVQCELTTAELGTPGQLRRAIVSVGFHKDPNTAPNEASKRAFLLVDRGDI